MAPELSGALPLITPAELAGGAAAHPLLDSDGRIVDPVLLVDRNAPDHPRAMPAALASPRILIGVATRAATGALAAALDLTLIPRTAQADTSDAGLSTGPTLVGVDDPYTAAGALVAAVRANPHAATVLTGLLRAEIPSGAVALEAESLAYSTLLGGPEFRRWLDAANRPAPPPPARDPVLVRHDGDVLHVTLNRPDRRNAYGREVRDALVAALDVARVLAVPPAPSGPPVGPGFRVVLDGGGPVFCAGGDLGEFGSTPDPVTAHLIRLHAGAALPLLELSEVVEAHVHGACVGAGVELPAFAARVIAAPGTTFRLPELAMGLIPGAGGTVSLPRRIGRWRTFYLAISGVELDLERALDWRLVDQAG